MGSSLHVIRSSLRGAGTFFVAAALAASKQQLKVVGFSSSNHPCSLSRILFHSPYCDKKDYHTTLSQLKMTTHDSTTKRLFLFDFDGVVCDSCDECTVSAWRTCRMLNAIPPDFLGTSSQEDTPPQWLFEKMREIRPAIEVGWQIPVLLSVFLDQQANSSPSNPPMSVPEVLETYEQLVEEWLKKYKLTEKDMVNTFGKIRDDWISDDLRSWLEINTFYKGISKAINECAGEAVLVTTKQQRFATALVRHAGVSEVSMPDESVYGLGMYKSKADVIADRMRNGGYETALFFEDRWPTIARALSDERLGNVSFYLCSWGYCTERELKLASEEPRVEVIKLEDFPKIVT